MSCFLLIVLLCGTTASSQELPLVSSHVGECTLTLEVNKKWNTMRLRAHHPNYKTCNIDKDSMVSLLNAAFSGNGSRPGDGYSSLSLGRLIDYPWMAQYLARTAHHDRGWDSKRGKPCTMDINKYVSELLFRKELMAEITAVLEKGGYRVGGVTVEKVLVGGFREIPFYQGEPFSGRVPYDAQVWLRLGKN